MISVFTMHASFLCNYSMASLVHLLFYASCLCVVPPRALYAARAGTTLDVGLAHVQCPGCASGLALATGKVFGFLMLPLFACLPSAHLQ